MAKSWKYCWKHARFRRFGVCPECAAKEIKPLVNHATIYGRMAQLLGQPTLANQDVFGVCGMVCALYLLLRYQVPKAWQLFGATFADVDPNYAGYRFATPLGSKQIDFTYLARRYVNQQKRAQAYNAARMRSAGRIGPDPPNAALSMAPTPGLLVDFCLCRALGYLLKKTASDRYESEKLDFNNEFTPSRNYQDVTRSGHLALRTNNLAFILRDLLGARNMHIASKSAAAPAAVPSAPPVPRVAITPFADFAQLQNQFQTRLTGAPAFAVAAIYADLLRQGPHVTNASGGHARLPFNHWVVIEGFAVIGGDVRLRIWTWGRDYQVDVDQNVLLSYIRDVIFGRF